MMIEPTVTQIRRQRERRIFVATIVVCVLSSAGVFAWIFGPAYLAYWRYVPQPGDIIFQSLPHSPLVNAIEGTSQSPFSHCGIVANVDGRWIVYEAYHNVEATPLGEYLFRGRNQGFAVYRLKSEFQSLVPAILERVITRLGRPYDVRYRMEDDEIYCTELIYKAYQESTNGQQLGKLVRMRELNWQPYEKTIQRFEGGAVPLDREMITPRDMAKADQLEQVVVFNIHVDRD